MADFQDIPPFAAARDKPAIVRALNDQPAPMPAALKAQWEDKAVLPHARIDAFAPLTSYEKTAALAEQRIGPAPGLEGIAVPSIN